jgi:hypothetical protein
MRPAEEGFRCMANVFAGSRMNLRLVRFRTASEKNFWPDFEAIGSTNWSNDT